MCPTKLPIATTAVLFSPRGRSVLADALAAFLAAITSRCSWLVTLIGPRRLLITIPS